MDSVESHNLTAVGNMTSPASKEFSIVNVSEKDIARLVDIHIAAFSEDDTVKRTFKKGVHRAFVQKSLHTQISSKTSILAACQDASTKELLGWLSYSSFDTQGSNSSGESKESTIRSGDAGRGFQQELRTPVWTAGCNARPRPKTCSRSAVSLRSAILRFPSRISRKIPDQRSCRSRPADSSTCRGRSEARKSNVH